MIKIERFIVNKVQCQPTPPSRLVGGGSYLLIDELFDCKIHHFGDIVLVEKSLNYFSLLLMSFGISSYQVLKCLILSIISFLLHVLKSD